MTNLSIIILSYNTKALTLSCIESLISQYKKELEKGEFEVIVVDNGSKDGSAELIEEKFMTRHSGKQQKGAHPESPTAIRDAGQASMTENGNFTLIKNKENFGFAKGCNIGASMAKGKYILFLNSDTETKDRGFIKMIEFLEKNDNIGILGGRLLNIDGSKQSSAGKFYSLFNLFLILIGAEVLFGIRKSPIKISKVDWVSGGCMMVKKSLFEKLSGFDENFFMYIEDMELCYRAKKLGSATYFYPDVKVLHKELGSGNRAFAIINIYKGILYFYNKHKNYLQYSIAKTILILKAKVAIIIGTFTSNSILVKTYRTAIKF